MAAKLSPKQARFVTEYLVDLNGKQAAIRAGYPSKTAHIRASQLLSLLKVRQTVDEAIERRSARVEVKQDDVLRELLRIMTTDIAKAFDSEGRMLKLGEMPEDIRRAVSSVEVEQMFEGSGQDRYHSGDLVKLKLWNKGEAITLAMKHLGLLKEKLEVSTKTGGLIIMLPPENPDG